MPELRRLGCGAILGRYGERDGHRQYDLPAFRPARRSSVRLRDRCHGSPNRGSAQRGGVAGEIAANFGYLSLAQVHAALAYYYANKGEIDADLEAENREYDALSEQHRR